MLSTDMISTDMISTDMISADMISAEIPSVRQPPPFMDQAILKIIRFHGRLNPISRSPPSTNLRSSETWAQTKYSFQSVVK